MIRPALCLLLYTAPAAANPCPLPEGAEHHVLRVEPDGALLLDDRREILLAGVSGEAAMTTALQALTKEQAVRLAASGARPDRWGRETFHVWRGEALLAADLIAQGAALRAPGFADEACARHLEGLEPPWPKTTRGDLASDRLGSALRLEGEVAELRTSGRRVYMTLRTEAAGRVTASLRDSDLATITAGQDVVGRTLRLRGHLEWWGEPVVVVAAARDAVLADKP